MAIWHIFSSGRGGVASLLVSRLDRCLFRRRYSEAGDCVFKVLSPIVTLEGRTGTVWGTLRVAVEIIGVCGSRRRSAAGGPMGWRVPRFFEPGGTGALVTLEPWESEEIRGGAAWRERCSGRREREVPAWVCCLLLDLYWQGSGRCVPPAPAQTGQLSVRIRRHTRPAKIFCPPNQVNHRSTSVLDLGLHSIPACFRI